MQKVSTSGAALEYLGSTLTLFYNPMNLGSIECVSSVVKSKLGLEVFNANIKEPASPPMANYLVYPYG